MKSTVAILLATYNGEKYLNEQIESILSQSYPNWHLYIRDDGSIDKTISIVKKFQNEYENITLLEDKKGCLGVRDQFLYMLEVVDADYYMFCDQDDVWFPDKIEKSLQKMHEIESIHPNKAILIGSDCTICGPELEVVNMSCWDHLRINPRVFLSQNGIYVYPFVTGASMILNKKVKDILPAIPEGLPKNRPMYDWWVLINTFKYGVVDLIEEPTRYYRQHYSNVSGGVGILNTSYYTKIRRIKKTWEKNILRAKVLKRIGYSPMKYFYYKWFYLCKMLTYKHKLQ